MWLQWGLYLQSKEGSVTPVQPVVVSVTAVGVLLSCPWLYAA